MDAGAGRAHTTKTLFLAATHTRLLLQRMVTVIAMQLSGQDAKLGRVERAGAGEKDPRKESWSARS